MAPRHRAPVILEFQGVVLQAWREIRGGPTPERPDVTFRPTGRHRARELRLTIRVPDCQRAYQALADRGAVFLAPPGQYEGEIRVFSWDPDGHLLEISQTTPRATTDDLGNPPPVVPTMEDHRTSPTSINCPPSSGPTSRTASISG